MASLIFCRFRVEILGRTLKRMKFSCIFEEILPTMVWCSILLFLSIIGRNYNSALTTTLIFRYISSHYDIWYIQGEMIKSNKIRISAPLPTGIAQGRMEYPKICILWSVFPDRNSWNIFPAFCRFCRSPSIHTPMNYLHAIGINLTSLIKILTTIILSFDDFSTFKMLFEKCLPLSHKIVLKRIYIRPHPSFMWKTKQNFPPTYLLTFPEPRTH